MANFNNPTLTSLYTNMVNEVKDRDVDILKWLDGTSSTNLPSGAKRWNASNNYFEKFNGTSWSPLTAKYIINVDQLDGCTVNDSGVSTTDLWTASKITNVLTGKLDVASYTANDILTKIKTVDGAGSGLDADLLDGKTSASSNTVNTIVLRDSSGNFSANVITASLTGNASTATSLLNARTINGTSFNGSANITTAKWGTARTLSLTGDVTGSVSIDGSANKSISTTVANDSHTHSWTSTITNKPTTLQGYGITPEELGASINLDTLTSTGVYSQSANAETSVSLNYPVAQAGLLEVYAYSAMVHQRYWAYNSTNVYYRAKYSTGTWTSWYRMGQTADSLTSSRTLSLSGDGTTTMSFDGSANTTSVLTVNSIQGSIPATTALANTIVKRDAFGGIVASSLATTTSVLNNDANYIVTMRTATGEASKLYPSTPGHIIEALNVPTKTDAHVLRPVDALSLSGNILQLHKGDDTSESVDLSVAVGSYDAGHVFTGTNGYQKLSNGFILQWGTISGPPNAAIPVTFPITFPSNCINMGFSFADIPYYQSTFSGICLVSKTTSSATLGVSGGYSSTNIFWYAIGY